MLDTKLEPVATKDEAAQALAEADEATVVEDELTDEELADEVVVEISVDGMCGVY